MPRTVRLLRFPVGLSCLKKNWIFHFPSSDSMFAALEFHFYFVTYYILLLSQLNHAVWMSIPKLTFFSKGNEVRFNQRSGNSEKWSKSQFGWRGPGGSPVASTSLLLMMETRLTKFVFIFNLNMLSAILILSHYLKWVKMAAITLVLQIKPKQTKEHL